MLWNKKKLSSLEIYILILGDKNSFGECYGGNKPESVLITTILFCYYCIKNLTVKKNPEIFCEARPTEVKP